MSKFEQSAVNSQSFEQQMRKAILGVTLVSAPHNFSKIILQAIEIKQHKILRRNLIIYSAVFAMAVVALITSLRALLTQFSETGTVQMFSLLFSDSKIIFAHWQEFSLSVVESFPVVAFTYLVGSLSILVFCLKLISRSIKNLHLTVHK